MENDKATVKHADRIANKIKTLQNNKSNFSPTLAVKTFKASNARILSLSSHYNVNPLN